MCHVHHKHMYICAESDKNLFPLLRGTDNNHTLD